MYSPIPGPESQALCDAIRSNIDAVAKLEEDYNRQRTAPERIADAIADFSGSLKFVLVHVVIYGIWILMNLRVIPGRVFDPYPFVLLSMVVSVEAIFLATFVLIKQNRMSQRADHRAHLDLQVNLLAEREMTVVLQILQDISTRLGVAVPDREIRDLVEETSVETLASELRERLPE
ncbi:MAG: DUF1003 domain-containing protein [Acidobacteriia bacterium]|nr:DUF1003 domain-containing protein [Terriglobia bacterium]MBV8904566.1 DUF1003 domain-containing protein [Terriglobia bacterium]